MNKKQIVSLILATLSAYGCGDSAGTGGGSAGGGGGGGAGGEGGGTSEEQTLSGELDTMTLTSNTRWKLEGVVTVPDGATLTIEPGTTIVGDKSSLGTLVVKQGGRLVADGTAEAPIVFTSALPPGERTAGDWGGVVLLGRAKINEPGGTAAVEGFSDPQNYGGNDDDDDSGVLRYVRIEFGGVEIAPDNEVNGLTLAGVGRGTTIDYVQVRSTLDDCFEFFGGSVNAKHLVCHRNGDDGFDFDQGYHGSLQFLFLQQDPAIADDANGFEADNDKDDPEALPRTNPSISNVTLCGQDGDQAKQQYGFLFRRGFMATITNTLALGFEAGVDFRDVPPTEVEISHSIIFGSSVEAIAYVEDQPKSEDGAPNEDDDGGFDEISWFELGEGNLSTDPGISGCFGATPSPFPASELPGGSPVGEGADSSASFIGAFRDSDDNWMAGWTEFSDD